VSDRATAALMGAFYDEMLVAGRAPAAALRAAQRRLRAQPAWENPYYWAAFVIAGDWDVSKRPPAEHPPVE
jgi:CHAT domain-containing protein